jgi:uncharacterized RDD family membrane protein YckC
MSNELPPAAPPASPAAAAPAAPVPAGGLPIEPMNLAVMRLVALLIDGALMMPIYVVMWVLMIVLAFIPVIGWLLMILMYFAVLAMVLGYHIYFISKFGATFGKRWMGLRVVQDPPGSGNPSFGSVILRLLVHIFTCGIGPLLAAFDKEGKGLHDKVAKTRVLKVKEPGFDGFGMKQA